MRNLLVLSVVLVLPGVVMSEKAEKKAPAVLDFKMKDIGGKEVNLAKYQGKVVMFVNVASRCGYTKQYKQLQAMHDKYADKGLVIIGVPANEFGKQEPGTDAQIKEFCTSKFDVKFPLLSKVAVKGKDITPLYEHLTKKTDPKFNGDIKWNFTKFLVGRNGEVIARFEPAVKPDAAEVVELIETELKK